MGIEVAMYMTESQRHGFVRYRHTSVHSWLRRPWVDLSFAVECRMSVVDIPRRAFHSTHASFSAPTQTLFVSSSTSWNAISSTKRNHQRHVGPKARSKQ